MFKAAIKREKSDARIISFLTSLIQKLIHRADGYRDCWTGGVALTPPVTPPVGLKAIVTFITWH